MSDDDSITGIIWATLAAMADARDVNIYLSSTTGTNRGPSCRLPRLRSSDAPLSDTGLGLWRTAPASPGDALWRPQPGRHHAPAPPAGRAWPRRAQPCCARSPPRAAGPGGAGRTRRGPAAALPRGGGGYAGVPGGPMLPVRHPAGRPGARAVRRSAGLWRGRAVTGAVLQVQQVNKAKRFACPVCGQKQSVRRVRAPLVYACLSRKTAFDLHRCALEQSCSAVACVRRCMLQARPRTSGRWCSTLMRPGNACKKSCQQRSGAKRRMSPKTWGLVGCPGQLTLRYVVSLQQMC